MTAIVGLHVDLAVDVEMSSEVINRPPPAGRPRMLDKLLALILED